MMVLVFIRYARNTIELCFKCNANIILILIAENLCWSIPDSFFFSRSNMLARWVHLVAAVVVGCFQHNLLIPLVEHVSAIMDWLRFKMSNSVKQYNFTCYSLAKCTTDCKCKLKPTIQIRGKSVLLYVTQWFLAIFDRSRWLAHNHPHPHAMHVFTLYAIHSFWMAINRGFYTFYISQSDVN